MGDNKIASTYLCSNFHDAFKRIARGKLLITHYGEPVAYLISIRDLQELRRKAETPAKDQK